MYRNETSVNGTRLVYYPEQPGTSSNSAESVPSQLFSDSGHDHLLFNNPSNMPALNPAMFNAPHEFCHMSYRGVTEPDEDPSLLSFTELDEEHCPSADDWNAFFPSPVGTEHEYGSSFDWTIFSDSTFTCRTARTMTSTPEQGDQEAEGVNSSSVAANLGTDSFAGLTGSPALHPAHEDHPESAHREGASHDNCQANSSAFLFAPVGNNGSSINFVGNPVIQPTESCISGSVDCRTGTGCVSACHDHRNLTLTSEVLTLKPGEKWKRITLYVARLKWSQNLKSRGKFTG